MISCPNYPFQRSGISYFLQVVRTKELLWCRTRELLCCRTQRAIVLSHQRVNDTFRSFLYGKLAVFCSHIAGFCYKPYVRVPKILWMYCIGKKRWPERFGCSLMILEALAVLFPTKQQNKKSVDGERQKRKLKIGKISVFQNWKLWGPKW